VITDNKLSDLCPVLNARMETVRSWNGIRMTWKLGYFEGGCIGPGMLTMIRKAFDLVEQHYGKKLDAGQRTAGRPESL